MHPGQPSGVVHPPRQRLNRWRRRRAGVTETASPFSGIRCRCAAADSRGVALVPRPSIFLPVRCCRPLASGSKPGCAEGIRIPAVRLGHVYSSPSRVRAPNLPERGRGGAGPNCGLVVPVDGCVRDDVDPPAGELGRQARVLAFLADGEGQLVIRNHDAGGAGCFVRDGDRIHPRG
jgi:hypothetical protein